MRTHRFWQIVAIVAMAGWLAAWSGTAPADGQGPVGPIVADGPTPEEVSSALAAVFARRAADSARIDPLTTPALQLVSDLYGVAVRLAPNDPEILRGALAAAALNDDQSLRSDLLKRLSALEPQDEFIRLARINDALGRYQSAEELIDAYRVLLNDENARALGAPVASRLATALAALYRRAGETEAYAEWIGKATALDQANKEAAGQAAGYFQLNVDDPFAHAELFVNLLLADPTDLLTQTALARHLLEHGAYEGAVRMYALALTTHEAFHRPLPQDLVADYAIALWGAGFPAEALEAVQDQQQLLDESIRMRAWLADPMLGPAERLELKGVLPLTLAVVNLALLQTEDREATVAELNRVQSGITESLTAAVDLDPETRQQVLLTQAWLAAWFDAPAEAIQGYLDQATSSAPINATAAARFEGWRALRAGDFAAAETALAPIAEQDPPAMAALALVRLSQDRTDEATAHFTTLTARDPGSVLGVWARTYAIEITGRVPVVPETAGRMNELIASIPRAVDRIPSDPMVGVSLRILPGATEYKAFEPLPVRIIVTNFTGLPVGISSEGALRPGVIVQPRIMIPGQPRLAEGPAIVVDMGRRFRLAPRERLEVEIDLRNHPIGDFVDAAGARGATLELLGTVNAFAPNQHTLEPGPMGYAARSPLIRVDGARLTQQWIEGVTATLRAGAVPDLSTLGILISAVHEIAHAPENRAPEVVAASNEAAAALLERFPMLDPMLQAWVLAKCQRGSEALKPLVEAAAAIDSPIIRLVYLANHLEDLTDPVLQSSVASADAELVQVATHLKQLLEQRDAATSAPAGQTPAPPPPPGGGGQERPR